MAELWPKTYAHIWDNFFEGLLAQNSALVLGPKFSKMCRFGDFGTFWCMLKKLLSYFSKCNANFSKSSF